jgi:putative FmdB family regulatory protein
MPTYDYQCPKCGTFEVYQSIKDKTLTACPTCKSKKLTKLLSTGGGVIFSGSGFWETDYNRSKDYTSKKKSESSPAATPAATPAAPATPAVKPASPAPAK